jgi:hypothetical protein
MSKAKARAILHQMISGCMFVEIEGAKKIPQCQKLNFYMMFQIRNDN